MTNKLILFVLCILIFCACNSGSGNKATTTTAQEQNNTTHTAQVANQIKGEPIQPMDEAYFMNLYKKTDAIDYVFYDLPFSMSQTELTAVQANVGFIAMGGPGGIPTTCPKALGRKFFKYNGEVIGEAEMYFSPGCQFYVFMDGNIKAYANNMTTQGVNFYNNIISQVQGGGAPNQ